MTLSQCLRLRAVPAFDTFAKNVLGAAAGLGETSKLRRLLFAASTLSVAQVKAQLAGDTPDTIRKLPLAEKAERLRLQKLRLPGILFEGEHLPSHSLIDLCSTMSETNAVVWVHPSKCTKRDDEIALLSASQSRSQLVSIENQSLKLTPSPADPEAVWATPMKLQMCLKRRGLAMDMCNLITWHEHEKWISTLFEAFNQDSPQGFSPPSLAQLLKADREIFLRMSKDVGSLKLDKDGKKPLDLALARLRCDPRVTMHLLCVAGAKQSAAIADAPTVTGEDP